MHIRNPIEWSGTQLVLGAQALGAAYRSLQHVQETIHSPAPSVRTISAADIADALRKGYADFGAYRSDVIFAGVVYVVAGLILSRLAFGMNLLPMLFPLASGFALIGPFAAIGLYEMSRRREQGCEAKWSNAFDTIREPAMGAITILGIGLVAILLLWLSVAWIIYMETMGPELPASLTGFVRDVFTTPGGWAMTAIGIGTGLVFAVFAMSVSIVSFPLLLDRDVGIDTAVETSIRAVAANPGPMALWGAIVTGLLVLGTVPLFMGLVVVLPVLGHATWHLYRKLVGR